MHPIKRLGTPEDVARAALFLASDESAWITDIIVDVAGGSVLVEKENERINGRRTESLMISRLETQHKYLASLLPGQFVSRTRKEI
jgi:hypothetical protein